MATKKKSKKAPAKKKAVKKAASKPAVSKSKKSAKGKAKKAPAKAKAKKALAKAAVRKIPKGVTKKRKAAPRQPKTDVLPHGDDQHLIPVTGEIHPARINEAPLLEKQFEHKQEIAFQQENQRVKAAQASRKNTKGLFRNYRH